MNNADWWAKKLGTPQPQVPQGRPVNNVPMPPTQQPMAQMPSFQQSQAPSKAQSASQTATCPDCGSSNYLTPSPTIALRCYDCGYPVQQSGSRFGSLTGAHVEGPTKAATGNDTVSNWNPQGIIGRIGE